ncbi:MAG TPA: hypothetical protein VJS20_01365, partial [Gemmatimonadales bacterium]|nr:hypothetical protein [Gemmatimonadales bacterium]
YLSPEELDAELTRRRRDYFRFLGGAALRGRDQGFWQHHQEGLAAIGYDLTAGRRAWLALGAAMDLLLNPLDTARALLGRE